MTLEFFGGIQQIVYQTQEGGSVESSGLGDMFNSCVGHLSNSECEFLRHWDRLIDLEAQDSQAACSDIWRKTSSQRKEEGSCLSSMVLDLLYILPGEMLGKSDQCIYCFHRQNSFGRKRKYSKVKINNDTIPFSAPVSLLKRAFKCDDHVDKTVIDRMSMALEKRSEKTEGVYLLVLGLFAVRACST